MKFFSLLLVSLFFFAPAEARAEEGISGVYEGGPAAAPVQSVLFIGNSYTYVNNVPQMVAQLTAGDVSLHAHLVVQSATRGGKTLQELWKDDQVRRLFTSRHWDVVVLQEQSLWAVAPERVEATAKSFRTWASAIKAQGGRPVLYETWARQPDSFWYTDRRYTELKNPKVMQEAIDAASDNLAAQNGAGIARAGEAFATALAADRKYPLYAEDSSHPSLPGSYLAALVIYKAVTGHALQNPPQPAKITPETVATLRKIAAETP